MKNKSIKRFLTATLAATMIMASTLTVAASGGSAGSQGSTSSSSSSSSKKSESKSEETAAAQASTSGVQENAGGSADGGAGGTASVAPTVKTYSANSSISIAGTSVKTTVAGAFDVKTVQGAAVTTPLADVKASLGLKGSQAPYVMVFDTDAKKSNLAMKCVNATAEALGGQVVTSLNVNLGAKENGKIISLSNGNAGMMIGLPKNADKDKTYSVVCVQPGGVITVLKDQDSSPATVTFEIKAGIGTYGIVAK